MARFDIKSSGGDTKYSGSPVYNGTYLKPSYVEFREIASPTPITWEVGDYVDYSRTGLRYKIYNIPQVLKQAKVNRYGGAFIYKNVQFFDASKELEYCLFRDLVTGDNRIHFSTQPSISTFEDVEGLAARFEACLREQYDNGSQSWRVRIATQNLDGISEETYALMKDPREFTVSGVNILECLDKVYSIWPEIGWVYRVENGINTIVIGGAGANANEGAYVYGKGRGLKSLTRSVANAGDLANRIYAYGSQRNMMSDWYRSKAIKDAASVDIAHLMIPTSYWGTTDGLPDAAKAYLEAGASIAERGLRPRVAYFDGTEDLPEIYPTIEGMTIGDIVGLAGLDYYPDTSMIWRNLSTRVDEIHDADSIGDDGFPGSSGNSRIKTVYQDINADTTTETIAGTILSYSKAIKTFNIDSPVDGSIEIVAELNFTGTFTTPHVKDAYISLVMGKDGEEPEILAETHVPLTNTGNNVWSFSGGNVNLGATNFAHSDSIFVSASLEAVLYALLPEPSSTVDEGTGESVITGEEEEVIPDRTIVVQIANGSARVNINNYRAKTFHVTLRQLGFDISERASLGDGMTISMRSGMCQGRSFAIKDCIYQPATDTWDVECYRSEDESLGQWFPNATFPIKGPSNGEHGDRFVLLDIAMPDSYVEVAETRLYNAAQELLADTATERWQYDPEIDAKFMVENNRVIRAGEYMVIVDSNIIDGTDEELSYFATSSGGYFLTSSGERILLDDGGYTYRTLVDSVTINEGEAAIPTYKVTLRDRKRKVFTESKSISEFTARSVADYKEVSTSKISSSSEFFELVSDSNTIKLKDEYAGLWALGFISAGGISTSGSGGGGGGGGSYANIKILHSWSEWTEEAAADPTYVLGANLGVWLYNQVDALNNAGYATRTWVEQQLANISLTNYYTKAEVDALIFFELDTQSVSGKTLVKLKTAYDGLYADGFISAGGISSSGSGGGGSSTLRGLSDVNISSLSNGDILSYNGSEWVNIRQSSIVPDLSGYVRTSTLADYYTKAEIQASYLTSTQIGNLYYNKTYIDSITFFEEVTSGTKTLLKLKDKYAGLFATGFISAGGISDSPSGGGSNVNAIRSWDDYVATDTTQVLGANLGVSLNTRLQAVENAGYITSSALNGYALQSWVTTQISNSVPSATTALGDGKYIPNGTSVSSAICGFAIANGTNLSSSYSIGVNSDSSNPYIFLKQGGNVWYCQAYSDNFYFGPTYRSALCITTSGNGSLPGAFSANEFIKYGGTSSQFLKADGSVDSTSYATASALSTVSGNVSTLQGYFTNGSAKTALKLASPVTLWGQSFDGSSNVSGALSSVTNLNSLVYLGSNAVGIGVSNPAYSLDVSGSGRYTGNLYVAQKIYLDTSGNYYIELRNVGTTSSPVWALYTNAPIVSTSFISAGGVSTT